MLRAVVFDVDGTLMDSNELHVEAWRLAFERYGKRISSDAIRDQIGKGGDQLMPVFLSEVELGRCGADLERYRTDLFVREFLPRARPFPGVRALFERLRADGRRIVLASSAKGEELRRHLDTLGVGDLVDGATSADDADHSKPCPDIFRAALDRLPGVTPDEALVVGDTPYDVIAARRAGMRTVALLSGGFSRAALEASAPAAIYRDIADLRDRYATSPLANVSS